MSDDASVSSAQNPASDTSPSDGVERLTYTIISQDADEVQDIQNAPAVSMGRFLAERDQMELIPAISIYAERGSERKCIRLFYMNSIALRIWKEMGMNPTEIGTRHRPTRTAVLAFGMPFNE
jgi:hypothetical protein